MDERTLQERNRTGTLTRRRFSVGLCLGSPYARLAGCGGSGDGLHPGTPSPRARRANSSPSASKHRRRWDVVPNHTLALPAGTTFDLAGTLPSTVPLGGRLRSRSQRSTAARRRHAPADGTADRQRFRHRQHGRCRLPLHAAGLIGRSPLVRRPRGVPPVCSSCAAEIRGQRETMYSLMNRRTFLTTSAALMTAACGGSGETRRRSRRDESAARRRRPHPRARPAPQRAVDARRADLRRPRRGLDLDAAIRRSPARCRTRRRVYPLRGQRAERHGRRLADDPSLASSVLSRWPDGSAAVVVVAGEAER